MDLEPGGFALAGCTAVAGLCKLSKRLEAAIGFEPMNKGFARPVFIDLFRESCYSVILKIAPDPPARVPTVEFKIFLRRFRRWDSLDPVVLRASSVMGVPKINVLL